MNVYTLPLARQRLLATGILAAVLAIAGFGIAAPLADMVNVKREAIRKGEAELARWRGIAASAEVMRNATNDPSANVRASAIALPASTDAQAAASVQAMVRRILGDAGADLKSVQPLDPRRTGSLREAGVRIVAVATQRQLDDTLFALDHANPRLFIREANIQLASSGSGLAGEKTAPMLQVRLDVYAYALSEE
ncbi:MAG: type II secretion system protein GspM [Hyphomonas sp.]|jgi:general secretion pathway protein M